MRLVIVGAVALTLAGAAGRASAAEDVGKTLTDLEAKWSAASKAKDVKTLGSILAPDWIGRGSHGTQQNRAKVLADVSDPNDKLTSIRNHDVVVRVFGNIAVVQGYDDETGSDHGKDTSGTYSWTDVFQKRAGQWVAVASQTTKVTGK
jgi:ketosteroid isomerase-like protein